MNYCLVCYSEEQLESSILSCKCCVCISCADYWFYTYIKERKYDRKVKCPNVKCPQQKEYYYEDLQQFVQANEQILINYCQISNDISYCPSCNFRGFYDESHLKHGCSNSFTCLQCNNEWSLSSNSSTKSFAEIKSYLSKLWITSNCPNCMVKINKTGGCTTMSCVSCSHKFCWNCKQSISDHKFYYCFFYILIIAIIQTIPILLLLFILDIHSIIFNQITISFQIESFQHSIGKILDFAFRYTLYHIPIPLLIISIDNYSMLCTLPRLTVAWILVFGLVLVQIQIYEFISIFIIESFLYFFIQKFY